MTEFVACVCVAVMVGVGCYFSGKDEGRSEYHRGEIVCQQMLSGELECAKKKRAGP